MRYFTKELYKAMRYNDYLHSSLRISKNAEAFSEDYFKKLYKRKEYKYVNLVKTGYLFKFEDIWPEEPRGDFINESEQAKKVYFEQREKAKVIFANRPPFDPEQAKANFEKTFSVSLNTFKENLPDDILQKVADIRVLALGIASQEVKQEITRYCKQNEKRFASARKDYIKTHIEYQKQHLELPFDEDIASLHDCNVVFCRKRGNDITLTFDGGGLFAKATTIRMINCKIIKQDAPLHSARFLYNESYKSGDGYEIHLLFEKNELLDFIVYADKLECF